MANPRKRAILKGRVILPGTEVRTVKEEPPVQEEPTEEVVHVAEPVEEPVEDNEEATVNSLTPLKKAELVELAVEKSDLTDAAAKKLTKNELIEVILDDD